MSDNELYLLFKYIKSVLWRVAKCLSNIEEVRCLKVKLQLLAYALKEKAVPVPVPGSCDTQRNEKYCH